MHYVLMFYNFLSIKELTLRVLRLKLRALIRLKETL